MSALASPITADDDNNSDIQCYGSDADAVEPDKPEEEESNVEEADEPEDEKVEENGVVSDCPVDTNKDHKDLSSPMRLLGQEGNFISVSPTVGILEMRPPSYLPCLAGNEAMVRVYSPSYKHGGYSEPSHNYTSYLCGVKDTSSGTSESFTDIREDGAIDLQRDNFVEEASGDQNSMKQIRPLEMQSGDAMRPMRSRHPALDLRTRVLSPCTEIKLGNKHPAIVCDFFAKGWCIRGNSCSFVHIKDPVNKSGQQTEGELVTQNWKREAQAEEGIGGDAKRSKMPCTPVPLAATIERTSLYSCECSLNRVIQKKVGPSWHPDKSWPIASSPSYPIHAEGTAITQHLDMHYRYTSQVARHSPNLSLDTHLPTTCMSLSHHIPAQSGCSLPFSASFGESTVDSQQLLNSAVEYHDSISTFSGSEREDLPLTIGVQQHPIGCKLKISSCDWEPSVPFRPSFFITSSLSSAGDQNDPFYGSIEITSIGNGSLKAFILSQRSSQVPTNGEYVEAANHGSDDAKSSVSSHIRWNKNELEKTHVPRENGSVTIETLRTARSYLNYHFGRSDMGNTFGFEDVRPQVEASKFIKQRINREQKNSEMDVNFQEDGSMQIESKALRNFRFALVDKVKELLKPVWHEGRLSKDEHNMIVKKSVDKIISTSQPQQIPPNEDSIMKYLSFCEVKIVNLVNEYASIYGNV